LTTRSTAFATNSTNVSGARLTWFAPRIDTPMWDHIFPENGAQALSDVTKKQLIPRLVTVDEVAQAVLLLMQNEAITGETIHVDCGARLV
jgi:NAD(P)-dependent dehydrogenase (short-subunit alcohol dehydrogenase family)